MTVPGKSNTFTLQSGIDDLSIDAGLRPIDLSLSKTISDLTPQVGSNVTYTISVTNSTGFSTATDVTVQDLLPAGMNYVSDNGGGSYNSGTGVWTIPVIGPGAEVSLQVIATVLVVERKPIHRKFRPLANPILIRRQVTLQLSKKMMMSPQA